MNDYKNYLRMDAITFEMLMSKVAPLIERKDTVLREAIPTNVRLQMTTV